jgi:hypothetical protein
MPPKTSDISSLVQDLNWEAIRVASAIPGRIRLKSPQLRGDEAFGERIGNALGEVEGVTEVTVTPRTGSVLVRYDHERVQDLPTLVDRAAAVGMLPDGLDPKTLKAMVESRSNGAEDQDFLEAVQRVGRQANDAVKTATGGAIDLKGLAPLTLAGLGLRRLLRGGALEPVPWFNYFWFAFTLLVTFQPDTPEDASQASSARAHPDGSTVEEDTVRGA